MTRVRSWPTRRVSRRAGAGGAGRRARHHRLDSRRTSVSSRATRFPTSRGRRRGRKRTSRTGSTAIPEIRCYLPGVPRAMYMPYKFQIIQGTTKIMMAFEFRNADRTIHLDDVVPYPGDAFMGHSVGKWEGDTLVVDVSSFTPIHLVRSVRQLPQRRPARVERYTPITSRRHLVRSDDRGPEGLHAALEDQPAALPPRWRRGARLPSSSAVDDGRRGDLGHLRKDQLVKTWDRSNHDGGHHPKDPAGASDVRGAVTFRQPAGTEIVARKRES